jgi:hypothetical protein
MALAVWRGRALPASPRRILGDLVGVVGGVLEVLIERHAPGCFLRPGVDVHGADEAGDVREHLASHFSDGSVGTQWRSSDATIAVFDDGFMPVEIEHHDQ